MIRERYRATIMESWEKDLARWTQEEIERDRKVKAYPHVVAALSQLVTALEGYRDAPGERSAAALDLLMAAHGVARAALARLNEP